MRQTSLRRGIDDLIWTTVAKKLDVVGRSVDGSANTAFEQTHQQGPTLPLEEDPNAPPTQDKSGVILMARGTTAFGSTISPQQRRLDSMFKPQGGSPTPETSSTAAPRASSASPKATHAVETISSDSDGSTATEVLQARLERRLRKKRKGSEEHASGADKRQRQEVIALVTSGESGEDASEYMTDEESRATTATTPPLWTDEIEVSD